MPINQPLGTIPALQQQQQQAAQAAPGDWSINSTLGLLQGLGSLGASIAGAATGTGAQGEALAAGARGSIAAASQGRKEAQDLLKRTSENLTEAEATQKQISAARGQYKDQPEQQGILDSAQTAFDAGDVKSALALKKSADAFQKSVALFKAKSRSEQESFLKFIDDFKTMVATEHLSNKEIEKRALTIPPRAGVTRSDITAVAKAAKSGLLGSISKWYHRNVSAPAAPQQALSPVEKIRAASQDSSNPVEQAKARAFIQANPKMFQ